MIFGSFIIRYSKEIWQQYLATTSTRTSLIVPPIQNTMWLSIYSIIEWTHYLNMELNRICIGWKLASVQILHTMFYVCVCVCCVCTFSVSKQNVQSGFLRLLCGEVVTQVNTYVQSDRKKVLSTVVNWNEQRNAHVLRIEENDTEQTSLTNQKKKYPPSHLNTFQTDG